VIKRAFSLIEMIFTIVIISILLAVSIPKLGNILSSSKLIEIKSDIVLIREAIIKYKNKMILKNKPYDLDVLDTDQENLFSKILPSPIIASSEKKIGAWSKIGSNRYKIFIDNQNSVDFIYKSSDFSFDCDLKNIFCKELSQ